MRLIAILLFASALLCDAAVNGVVFFGSTDGNLSAIELPAGRLKQKVPPVASF